MSDTRDQPVEFTCDGEADDCLNGLRLVDETYVAKMLARVKLPDEIAGDPESVALFLAERRRTFENTRHPCPIHDPERFLAWRRGDWPKQRRHVDPDAAARDPRPLAESLPPAPEQLDMGDLT